MQRRRGSSMKNLAVSISQPAGLLFLPSAAAALTTRQRRTVGANSVQLLLCAPPGSSGVSSSRPSKPARRRASLVNRASGSFCGSMSLMSSGCWRVVTVGLSAGGAGVTETTRASCLPELLLSGGGEMSEGRATLPQSGQSPTTSCAHAVCCVALRITAAMALSSRSPSRDRFPLFLLAAAPWW